MATVPQPPARRLIATAHLFEEVDTLLIDLLASLSREDWSRPTIAGSWRVRDVAAHLLDTPLRRLTLVRDAWARDDVSIRSEADLVAFVNAANAEGVRVLGRLSPPLLVDLMALATRQLREHLASIDPHVPAAFPVSWAGDVVSPHWFDEAREYTERWHHQAQIRLAVGRLEPLMAPRLYAPVIETFMHAIPHACRTVRASDGVAAAILVCGEAGGRWTVRRTGGQWRLVHDEGPGGGAGPEPGTTIELPAPLVWRLFTKALTPDEVSRNCRVSGDARLADAILAARAIVG